METETPYAELLEEWKGWKVLHDQSPLADSHRQRMDAIAKIFDQACADAGIAFIEGQFWYARKFFSVVIEPEPYLLREVCDPYFSDIYREWLQIRIQ